MRGFLRCIWGLCGVSLFASGCRSVGAAEPPDPVRLYSISTEGSTTTLRAGTVGRMVVTLQTKGDASISSEAPLNIDFSGVQAVFPKAKWGLKDSVNPVPPGDKVRAPRFEVPFEAKASGLVEAQLTFFICTETLCVRQQKKVAVEVKVEGK